jgi:hypothetical protein
MTINRSPRTASGIISRPKSSETEAALKRATQDKKQGPGPRPTVDGIKRRKGAPEPASKH